MRMVASTDNDAKARCVSARIGKIMSMLLLVCVVVCGNLAAQTSTDNMIHSLQTHLKMYPQDFKSYDALGASYIQKGRETADAT